LLNRALSRTLRGSPVVMAPGKIFLVGEYAVLEGGAAVLAAVSRYAIAQYIPDLNPESPFIDESVKRAVAALGELAPALPAGSALVNTAAFRHRLAKLGLGSSAAAAVSSAAAVLAFVGIDFSDKRELLFTIADEGHRAAQGGVGSGADVAAAVHGGYIGFVRPPGGKPVMRTLARPSRLELVVFWTGRPSHTPTLVQAVRTFAERSASSYGFLIDELRRTADKFVDRFDADDAPGAIAEADAYVRTLEILGASAGMPIVSAPFVEAATLARQLGGTAKPSGAGGGDVGVALFGEAKAAAEFIRRCPAGISVLDVKVDGDGVRRRLPSDVEVI
jgi:phosphomevalonate kinase